MALIPKMGWAGRKGKGEVHRQEGFSFVHQPLYGGPALTWIGALLGRRQAVRQRLLMPPCAGSNPAAPATILAHFDQQGLKVCQKNVLFSVT